ncbi:hypothetical protein ZIOFF_010074 [Zingiber officinale]|uniref:RNase H type-1 domain-containing protein n=1 Tax=Zingiber officinale TaxID=94328 RepID=A0A8J5HLP9_ZINOF|nr:hypothetical protein ZIOFF_010074 [Zingiber officinale]
MHLILGRWSTKGKLEVKPRKLPLLLSFDVWNSLEYKGDWKLNLSSKIADSNKVPSSAFYRVIGALYCIGRGSVYQETGNERALWEKLLDVKPVLDELWLVGGDFNVIMGLDEHSAGILYSPSAVSDFNDFLMLSGLLDAGFVGDKFTWTNTRVWKRLDRFLISSSWNDREFKLRRLKAHLNWWNVDVFGNIHEKVKQAEERLSEAEKVFDLSPNVENRAQLSLCEAQLYRVLNMEEIFWRQKAAVRWMGERDLNTKTFHRLVQQRRMRDFHYPIADTGLIPHLIKEEDNLGLSAMPSLDEIKKIIREMNDEGATGPDGYGSDLESKEPHGRNFYLMHIVAAYLQWRWLLKGRNLRCWKRMFKIRSIAENQIGCRLDYGQAKFCEEVSEVSIQSNVAYTLVWKLSFDSKFSSKSAWNLLKLPVDSILKLRGLSLASKCQCCLEEETWEHLFFYGPIALGVWRCFGQMFGVDGFSYLEKWRYGSEWSIGGHIKEAIPFLILWNLWSGKNKAKHRAKHWKRDISVAQGLGILLKTETIHIVAVGTPRVSSFEVVIRDHEGQIVMAKHGQTGFGSNVKVELVAMLKGLELCIENHLLPCRLESDSMVALKMLHAPSTCWELCNLVSKIHKLILEYQVRCTHVYREVNAAADYLANLAFKFPTDRILLRHNVDKELFGICKVDRIGLPYIRVSCKFV